jgi:hypothetical protein
VNVLAYIDRLYTAFSDAPRPDAKDIAPHRCLECDDVQLLLAPYDSRSVPDDAMSKLGDSLTLLGPNAFRYYLPRYIAFSIQHPESKLNEMINFNLAPSESLDEGSRDRFLSFAPRERQAVLEFVRYRAQLEFAELDGEYLEQAEKFWGAAPNKSLERTREG